MQVGVGSCGLAQFEEMFYRAEVQSLTADGRAVLRLVDFGNSTTVPTTELFSLAGDQSLLSTPALCFDAVFDDAELIGEDILEGER